jgi:hypothetical protein
MSLLEESVAQLLAIDTGDPACCRSRARANGIQLRRQSSHRVIIVFLASSEFLRSVNDGQVTVGDA